LPTSDIPSSNRFCIAETEAFQKQRKRNPDLRRVYRKIREFVYPMLRENPFFGPNIKRLRGDLSDFYRYRIGDYRLFYTIQEEELLVVVVKLKHRQSAYE
jgi:mRNA interferase RelE/StbE